MNDYHHTHLEREMNESVNLGLSMTLFEFSVEEVYEMQIYISIHILSIRWATALCVFIFWLICFFVY